MSDTDTPFPSAAASAEAPLRRPATGLGTPDKLSWRLDRTFTSAKSKLVAAVLIIAAFPAGAQVADLIRLHRFRR